MKVLVVGDDRAVIQSLQFELSHHHDEVDVVINGEMALQRTEACQYDLMILEMLLPGLPGITVCQQLRSKGFQQPILLLIGQGEAEPKAIALQAGADDCVVKPFQGAELITKVQALLHRDPPPPQPPLALAALSTPHRAEMNAIHEAWQIALEQLRSTQAELAQKNQELEIAQQMLMQERQQSQAARDELKQKTLEYTAELTNVKPSLQDQQNQWQALFDHVLDAIVIIDNQGNYIDANPSACDLFGLSREALLRTRISDFVDPEFNVAVVWRTFLQQGQMAGEFRLSPPNGTIRAVQLNAIANFVSGHHLAILRDVSDRKQAQVSFHQSEEKFRHFAENSHAVIWISQPNAVDNLYVSPAYERVWGRSRQSLRDRPGSWLEMIHPDDREHVRIKLEQQLRGESSNVEYRIVRPDGTIRWIWDLGFPIRSEAGEIDSFGGIAEDITDRKLAEIQLREMSVALSNAVEGISRLDPQGRYLFANDAYASMVGYTAEEMVGMDWKKTVHPDSLTSVIAGYEHMLETGKVELEAIGVRKDRSLFDKQLLMVSAYDDQHHFTGHHCFMKDISERKRLEADRQRAEAELKQSEQKLRAIFDSTFQLIGLLTPEGTVLDINRTALDIIAADLADVVGQPLWETPWWAAFPEQQQQLRQAIAQAATGEFIRFESKYIGADGKLALADFSLKPILDETGKVILLVPEGRDITQVKELEAQFYQAQRLESLGTLASGIAHDLNNVLTPILAIAQLLQLPQFNLNPRSQELLQILEEGAKRGAEMVRQILTFTRGTGESRSPIEVAPVLQEVVTVIQQTLPKSITIRQRLPDRSIGLVSANATQLHQVLINLCVNARDAMPDGGILTLALETFEVDEAFAHLNLGAQVGHYVLISITDTGIGIAPEVRDRIFDPFFTTKPLGQGTGLGLSIVLGIVKSYGGFIQVNSEVGKGCQLKLYLPIVEATICETQQTVPLSHGQGELVLIVDDDLAVQRVNQSVLENHHYQTLLAKDGLEAIHLYTKCQDQIRAVCMDLMMPNMDGLTAIRNLKTINPQVQIIAMSGLSSHREAALGAGARLFLEKPYSLETLLQQLSQILSPSALQDGSADRPSSL
jgi:PAS domain S-box-containing protein